MGHLSGRRRRGGGGGGDVAQLDFLTVFIYIYLPWLLVLVFGLTWVIFAFLAPREVWSAWRIKNTPGRVGFLLFDDAGQGTLKGMKNEADKGVFVTNKDEYQIVPTSPPIEENVPQYDYREKPEWTEEQRVGHRQLVDAANVKLGEQTQAKQMLGETIKKRAVLFNKPCYIGIRTIGMGASPYMLEVMQDSVEGAKKRKARAESPVKLISVDVLKQVLTLTYPPARIMSIGKRHENRVRKKSALNIPIWAIVLFVVIGIVILLVPTGVVDLEAVGRMIMGVGKK